MTKHGLPAIKIQVTSDLQALQRNWDLAYAKQHVGKIYDAELEKDGQALIDGFRFHPSLYEVIKEETVQEPEVGTLAHTARLMASTMSDDEDPDFWDRWKDDMKDELL